MSVPAWTDRKKVKADLEICGRAFEISWYFAAVFLLLGIVSDAANIKLGLEPASWFLLLIATLLAAIAFHISWAVAWYLSTTK